MQPNYMQLDYAKASLAAVWILAIFAIGLAAGVTSVFGWTVLAGLALLPVFTLRRVWKDAPHSMSESIQEAIR